ncbi:N-acetylneuraminate synthase [Eubacterium sp. 14-2]|uniref:N-acetylneuraminate synthase n=1 Tax=Eubacterium sp. 14-2 TaxID=1235790 RepID=UPI00033A9E92|nr:N-acetylneuraminate synthase [Eubacterium sp. 14-2]EOT23581.1 N-acetylneuraminate synthase [Eubacterium sp. 14-2]
MSIIIIAEAGVNHNGSLAAAKQMVLAARNAGADYIKFQTFSPEKLVSVYAEKAEYQKQTTGTEESQLEMLKKLALTQEDFLELKTYCRQQGIGFLSTPFDLDSIHFLDKLNMDFWKLPSGEITNLPYLLEIARTEKPVVMSTGMCGMEEIGQAVDCLKKAGTPEITLLHCNTEYPTPMKDVNLKAMITMEKEFCLPVGYSDHTRGIEIPVAAAALGACVLEKHFTLDRGMEGPDHQASLEPEELKAMVTAVRNVEEALGSGKKEPSQSEQKNRAVARKSIVAKCRIKKGERFSEENLTVKRPGTGISPMRWPELMGQTADRDYAEDELIGKDIL